MGVQPVGGGMVSPRAGRCGYRCQLTKDDYWDPFSFFQLYYKNRAAARCALSGLEPASLGARAGCIAPRQACGRKCNTAPAHVALSCSTLPALPPPALCSAAAPQPRLCTTPRNHAPRCRAARQERAVRIEPLQYGAADKACCLEYHMVGAGAETVFSGVEVGACSSKRAGACLATLL